MPTPRVSLFALTAALVISAACHHKPPVTAVTPPATPRAFPTATPATPTPMPPAPTPVPPEPTPVPAEPRIVADPLANRSLDELNRIAPLQPAFFALDSEDLDGPARLALNQDADVLKKNPNWVVSVEGHADERGSAEYNLALGERRALAAKTYLVSLGIAADRLRTVSYGKEFPFEAGHDEAAWAKNRRAHFMVTAK